MPTQSRSQRRRQGQRPQQRPAARQVPAAQTQRTDIELPAENLGASQTYTDIALPRVEPGAPASPAPSAGPASQRLGAAPARRAKVRPAPEPVDYTKDYAAARIDLRWIAIWAVLLFIAMIALKFSGLV